MQYFNKQSYTAAGFFTLAIRLVVGWTYFSAFWRRLVLDNKLIETEMGYIGEKFNHFLPNALFIKPLIEHLVTHPEQLWWAMAIFTIVEAVVGLFIMLGLFTRLMSVGVMCLAMGILLGSGWIGTTCLDEWQIGSLGVATGFILFLSGGGYGSLDHYFESKKATFTQNKLFGIIGSGVLPIRHLKTVVFVGSFAILFLTLYTNQVFHGGVYGTLHNKSVRPKLELSHVRVDNEQLYFQVYRTQGADVYGSFLFEIALLDEQGQKIQVWDTQALSTMDPSRIENIYVAKIKPGAHSLIIPLGAKAVLNLHMDNGVTDNAKTLLLTDISGIQWTIDVK
ncbi:TQO small subunit DoxD [Myroides sp. LJL116]